MTAPDPDAIQVLARAWHVAECLPGANPDHRYSATHWNVHVRRARLVLAEASNAGYALSPTET